MEWTPERVRALRAAYRLSREAFAAWLEASPKSVQNWETGAVGSISHHLQRALDSALEGATPAQRRDFEARIRDGEARPGEEHAVGRRPVLASIGSLAGGVFTSAYLESVELTRRIEASEVGPETLRRLDRLVEHLGLAYLHTPPEQTLREACAARQYVVELLDTRHTLAQRTRLYAVAGWLSGIIGHAALDLGHDDAVIDGHCETAVHLAREAGHGELVAWVRGTQAMAATFGERPRDAIVLAQGTLDAPAARPMTIARLHAQAARGHARLGDRPATGRALVAAEQAMGQANDQAMDQVGEPPTSIFSFSYPYLPFYGGTCHTWLGQPETAAARSQEAIAVCDTAAADWPVARVLARIDLAEALRQKNELDGVTQLAGECLDICRDGRRTGPIARRLNDLLHSLKPRLAAAPVRELEGRYRETFTAANTSASTPD